MPKPGRNVTREPVTELTRQDDDLASVVALMRDENQVRRDLAIGSPGSEQGRLEIRGSQHGVSFHHVRC